MLFTLVAMSSSTHGKGHKKAESESPIEVSSIEDHIMQGKPQMEFKLLESQEQSKGGGLSYEAAQKAENRDRNRYSNILPYDSTRVKLVDGAGSDYINANFIARDTNKKAYIATQGPLLNTIGDFWQMVWENKCSYVIMLGKEIENGIRKVDRYWPPNVNGSLTFGGHMSIRLTREDFNSYFGIFTRHVLITHSHSDGRKDTKEVIMYQYAAWPDHGVPSDSSSIRHLINLVHNERSSTTGPLVVHCSAGVGRTGTFIAIYTALAGLNEAHSRDERKGVKELLKVDLFGIVKELRAQRAGMVQQPEQYIFCYKAVLDEIRHTKRIPLPLNL